ncbi:GGDEF domain-containing protein [Acidovorax sp. RAC01]|uniref:GGDEF domain-containing protein n=1 Tax=Acidovorax sp. RAC01 TaxID=1842533 RepID=UPI00083E957D|nr:GGDEF domain-containing protein [Acidovorax sp. RAC01]AOG24054.1 diguanylate cyclase domain protein [Acidovorax sp. RAC01]
MPLDFFTLMAVMVANQLVLSAALPLIMGRDVSRAARHVQASLVLQAMAWVAAMGAGKLWEQALSSVFVAGQAAALWMLYRALEEWLGPRPLRRVLMALVVAAPLGYALGFDWYAWRVGWANGLLTLILLVVARATLRPARHAEGRWRRLLMACLLTSAFFTLSRGLLGAFTGDYPSFRTPHPINVAAALAANVSLMLSAVAVLVAWRYEAEQQLRLLAVTDGLTGLLNSRGYTAQGENLLAQAWRHRLPLTAIVLEVDQFKQINDRHGRDAGDRALRLFARLLSETCRSGDLMARLDGGEFGVLLLHNAAPAGAAFDRRLRSRLQDASAAELGFVLDYSVGMASLQPGEASLTALTARADAALQEAKEAGGGRLMGAG